MNNTPLVNVVSRVLQIAANQKRRANLNYDVKNYILLM